MNQRNGAKRRKAVHLLVHRLTSGDNITRSRARTRAVSHEQGRMAKGDHELPKVTPVPAMP
jgi:hypothetical protein